MSTAYLRFELFEAVLEALEPELQYFDLVLSLSQRLLF